MAESQMVSYRASKKHVSILDKYRSLVSEIKGIENPSNGMISKCIVEDFDQQMTNPDHDTLTLIEYLNNKDPNKKTFIELGIEAIKTRMKNE